MAISNELALMTQETITYYDSKFKKEKFPVPENIVGRSHLVSQYTKTWKVFDGLLEPEQYCEYARIVFDSIDEYDYYSMFDPEFIDRSEIDRNLKRCILALIDMELEDLQVEVKKLKKNSKYSTAGVSIKATNAVREIKDRVVSLVLDNKLKLEDILETKCQLIQWLSEENKPYSY